MQIFLGDAELIDHVISARVLRPSKGEKHEIVTPILIFLGALLARIHYTEDVTLQLGLTVIFRKWKIYLSHRFSTVYPFDIDPLFSRDELRAYAENVVNEHAQDLFPPAPPLDATPSFWSQFFVTTPFRPSSAFGQEHKLLDSLMVYDALLSHPQLLPCDEENTLAQHAFATFLLQEQFAQALMRWTYCPLLILGSDLAARVRAIFDKTEPEKGQNDRLRYALSYLPPLARFFRRHKVAEGREFIRYFLERRNRETAKTEFPLIGSAPLLRISFVPDFEVGVATQSFNQSIRVSVVDANHESSPAFVFSERAIPRNWLFSLYDTQFSADGQHNMQGFIADLKTQLNSLPKVA